MRRRGLFARQSFSSTIAATTSLSDVTTPTGSDSIPLSVTESTNTLGLSTETGPFSTPALSTTLLTTPTLSLSQTSSAPVATGTITSQPETTPSPTPTTSPQPPSSSPPSSTPTAPFSAPITSSPIPPQSTQSRSPSSTSPHGIPTTITTSITAYVNGTEQIVTQTSIPTTIPESSHNSSSSNRTAIIAGSAAGGTALLVLVLSLAFFARRKRFKRLDFLDALTLKRRQARSRAMLLAGEDFDDSTDIDLRPTSLPPSYSDDDGPRDPSQRSLDRRRGSTPTDSGSVFREDVWPPPGITERSRLMDDDRLIKDDSDFGRIVDDVMGPSATTAHFSERSISSSLRGSIDSEGILETHSRSGSTVALLDAAGLNTTHGVTSNAPTRSSPLAQPGTKAESSEHGGGAS